MLNSSNEDAPNNVTAGLFSILAPEVEKQPREIMLPQARRKKKKRRYGRQGD